MINHSKQLNGLLHKSLSGTQLMICGSKFAALCIAVGALSLCFSCDGSEETVEPNVETPETRITVVNVDIMASVLEMFGDDVYVGDDGVLSSPTGTLWNKGDSFTSITDADDEFGSPTSVDVVMNVTGGTFIGAAINELQDDGISTGGIAEQGFEWQGLIADKEYDLSFYVYAEVVLEKETTFDLTHAGGKISLGPNNEPTWVLPGEKGKDYLLLEKIKPYKIADGNYGFKIDNINKGGVIMGFQLKGLVTSPI